MYLQCPAKRLFQGCVIRGRVVGEFTVFTQSRKNRKNLFAGLSKYDLKVVDSYFATIGAKDVDDCGKKLVCEIETIASAARTVEEMLVSCDYTHLKAES